MDSDTGNTRPADGAADGGDAAAAEVLKKRAAAKELLKEIDGLRPGGAATAEDWRKALAKVRVLLGGDQLPSRYKLA
jgi:hypothetical protein